MKKSLLLALSIITASALAQPTLTASGCNLVVGDQLPLSNASYVAPGSAGASQTWDLSTMTTANTYTVNAVAPSSTTNGASFTNANVAINSSTSGYGYFKTSTTAFQNYGSDANSVTIVYTNPEDLMHYPFTYNATYSDAFAATFTTNGFTFYRTGTCTVTADGYGTVITPAGSFSNVMRVHLVEAYQDSTNVFGTDVINTYNNDEYMWMDNTHHIALASVSSLDISLNGGSPNNSQTGTFYGAPAGIASHNNLSASLNLFPNPASQSLKIQTELSSGSAVSFEVFNMLGTQVGQSIQMNGIQGINQAMLDVSTYAEGTYFVKMYCNGVPAGTRRFVVSR